MKILWFVNAPFPPVCKKIGIKPTAGGWWLSAAGEALSQNSKIHLTVAWSSPTLKKAGQFEEDNIRYYYLPAGRFDRNNQGQKFLLRREEAGLKSCLGVVNDFKPDLIHVHGTENFYGLITSYISRPVLISLQGILNLYVESYWGSIPFWKRILFPYEIRSYFQMLKNARREKEIFKVNHFFTGRTFWDMSQLAMLSPEAHYYSDKARILRGGFYDSCWQFEAKREFSIYTTTTPRPYKGTDTLIDATAILKHHFPNVHLRIGGPISNQGFGKYLHDKVKRNGLEENVTFIGQVNSDQIIKELLNTHVYVLPSFIENSPNSLAEAQMVGTPSVASFSGGTPSLVNEGKTGLLFPKGDYATLAMCIRRVFEDEELAIRLSRNSRKEAETRHDASEIISNLINIYQTILSIHCKA